MKFTTLAFVLGATVVCGVALAQPTGGFYRFKHKESGKIVCFQQTMNSNWIRQAGPFQDSGCKIEQKQEPARSDLPANPLDLTAPKSK